MHDLELLLLHLRLPFQLMLAPFVLLGALGTGTAPHLGWLIPFLAVHVGLYGGATAYNSYYDRDEGPIGFMKRPPRVPARVCGWALVLQAAAVAIVALVHPMAGLIASVMMGMGIAYSHPRTRWKASAGGGLAAVALGQGSLAVYLGYYALGGDGLPPGITHVSAGGAALVAMGLFPITQIYQIDEDSRRGDRTLPVRLGWRRALVFSLAATTLGLWLLASGLAGVLPRGAVVALAAAPVAIGLVVALWARRFEAQSAPVNHDWAMGIGLGASLGFWAILLVVLGGGAIGGPGTAAADEPGAFDDPDAPALPSVRVWKEDDRERVDIEATLDVGFPPPVVWPVVLDYDGLAAYMPNVDSSRVVARRDGAVRVRQVGSVRVIFKKTYRFELEYECVGPARVDFRQVAGDLEGYEGYWAVEPRPAGGDTTAGGDTITGGDTAASAGADSSRIIYRAWIERGLGAPWFLGRSVLYRSIREMMPAIRAEIVAREEGGADG